MAQQCLIFMLTIFCLTIPLHTSFKYEHGLLGQCQEDKLIKNMKCSSYETWLPSKYFPCKDLNCLDTYFERISFEGEFKNDFLCDLVYPRCFVKPLCKQYCKDAFSTWGKNLIFLQHVCDLLPSRNCKSRSIEKPPTALMCNKDIVKTCSKTAVSPKFHDYKNMFEKHFEMLGLHFEDVDNCLNPLAKFFTCSFYYPYCEEGYAKSIYPCFDYCDELSKACPPLMKKLNCDKKYEEYKNDACIDPLQRPNFSLKKTTKTPKHAMDIIKSEDPHFCAFPMLEHGCGRCQTFNNTLCRTLMGYSKTFFPNYEAVDEANAVYLLEKAKRVIGSGCNYKAAIYFCSIYFPMCEGNSTLMACRDLCEELKKDCGHVMHISCGNLYFKGQKPCLQQSLLKACDPEVQFRCDTKCIPKSQRCDGVYDCLDKSDEMKPCECKPNQIQCTDSQKCYMTQWICDGDKDCPNGEDESQCDGCAKRNAWDCKNGECITKSERCDGVAQCSDHSDEMKCISRRRDGTLLIEAAGYGKVPVCMEGLSNSPDIASAACVKLGQRNGSLIHFSYDSSNTSKFLLNANGYASTVLGKGDIVYSCPNSKLATLRCRPNPCGHSKRPIPPTYMESSLHGTWPWVAYILYDQYFLCGAAIFSDYFLLTSASCFQNITDLRRVQIVTGSKYLSPVHPARNPQPNKRFYKADNIIVHPDYVARGTSSENDIALVLTDTRITYNDETRPLCATECDDVFSKANDCFLAGWGQSLCKLKKDHLRHRKLTLYDAEKCNSPMLLNGTLRPKETCAEFYNGFVAIGKRDSGSPIFCNDDFGTFKLVGIAPVIKDDCLETEIIIFPQIQLHMDWIKSKTEPVFVCDNNHALVHSTWLCNNVDECGDNSDEVIHCSEEISFNCTFDYPFLCGYQFNVAAGEHLTIGGGNRKNTYPLFDHTRGNFPGHWISLPAHSVMKSPMVNVEVRSCVQFYYHMRKEIGMGAVIYHFDGVNYEVKFDLRNKKGIDRWLMGRFDVLRGPFQMFIHSYQDVFSIDDISLLSGPCEDQECLKEEFECRVNREVTCLPEAVRCNIVGDCDNNVDEQGCQAPPKFLCNFDDGNLCGLMQSHEDNDVNEWRMLKLTDLNASVNSLGDISGTKLRLSTRLWHAKTKVVMYQALALKIRQKYCLKFSYITMSNETLKVLIRFGEEKVIARISPLDEKTHGWRNVSVNILAKSSRATLYYQVTADDPLKVNHSVSAEVLIDHIIIDRSECVCPKNTVKCRGEDKCLPRSQVCDGKRDCRTNSDEKLCCKPKGVRCRNGKCVAKEKACNRVKDCPDGVDEGRMCDKRRNVTCEFDDEFLCGYTFQTFSADQLLLTYDKIIVSPTGNSSLIHGNDGNVGGDKKTYWSLFSVPFNASYQSVKFEFAVYHTGPAGNYSGRLDVSSISSGKKILLRSYNATTDSSLKSDCTDLPLGKVQIMFEAKKNPKAADMRFELASIILLKGICP